MEAKIKIPAAAKAPKVTIDYVKGIINIPKGVEFKISARGKEGNRGSCNRRGCSIKISQTIPS